MAVRGVLLLYLDICTASGRLWDRIFSIMLELQYSKVPEKLIVAKQIPRALYNPNIYYYRHKRWMNSIYTIPFLLLVSVLMLPFRPLLLFWESGSQFFSTTSKRALRATCLPVQIVPGFFPRGLNRSRCDIGHLPLCRAEVKNEWISTFAPPLCVLVAWKGTAWPV